MRNSPALPVSALVAAAVLTAVLGLGRLLRADLAAPLSEVDIGLATWAFVLGIFGAQGLISIVLGGRRAAPRVQCATSYALAHVGHRRAGRRAAGACIWAEWGDPERSTSFRCWPHGRSRLPGPGAAAGRLQGGVRRRRSSSRHPKGWHPMVITRPSHSFSAESSVSVAPPADATMPGRRRFLKWLIGAASAAFVASFGLPAVALKSLSVARTGVQQGDVLVLASGLPGVPAGQPLKLADLPMGAGVQVFPQGKTDNQNALIQLVRIGDETGLSRAGCIQCYLHSPGLRRIRPTDARPADCLSVPRQPLRSTPRRSCHRRSGGPPAAVAANYGGCRWQHRRRRRLQWSGRTALNPR